jgi:hypothetical protein
MRFLGSQWKIKRNIWWKAGAALLLMLALLVAGNMALANVSPEYLKNGRTFDQERNYIQWNGSVSYVTLFHRDNTSMPPSEGGAHCGNGCTEQVTRIQSGSSISGNFTYLKTFSVQVAYSSDTSVGRAIVHACGQEIFNENMYLAGGDPGFNNHPNPAWNVPTAGDCTWSISASGGYVDVRAVTTVYRTTPAPTVDLKVNGSNGPLTVGVPGSYTLSWSSTNAASCTASGNWSGAQLTNGSQGYSGIGGGSYSYTITCSNPSGSASDTVTVSVLNAPTVSVTAPAAMTAPASYSASWTSSNATSCTGSSRFTGLTGLTGSKQETGLPTGIYDYTVTCTNALGIQSSDTKRTTVYAAPTVDLKVDGSDGPTVTRTGPVSYSAQWTSSNATSCSGASRLSGYSGTAGARPETNVPVGTVYDYSVTCRNAAGATASETIRMVVVALPTVDVKVNGSNGPLNYIEPAGYTVSWSSTNATACTALDNLPGPITTNDTKTISNVLQGAYRYTVQCTNSAGTTAIDTVIVNVNPLPPVVDLKVEGGNGPLTLESPASYTLTWTSQHAASCTASSSANDWVGSLPVQGSQSFVDVTTSTRTYTLTCSNISGTVSDSVQVVVVAPLSGTLSVAYAKLLLFAPQLGLPAQTLSGSSSGGEPPYTIAVHVRTPGGVETTYSRSGAAWTVSSTVANDPNFGTTVEGVWNAWAIISDSASRSFRTHTITWDISWHPVHGRP